MAAILKVAAILTVLTKYHVYSPNLFPYGLKSHKNLDW